MKDVICNVQSEIFKVKCAEQFAELNLESKICRVEYADCNLQYAECNVQSAMCRHTLWVLEQWEVTLLVCHIPLVLFLRLYAIF